MLGLAWRTLGARCGSFAGAFLSLGLAVALVTGFGILLESALRAGAPAERFAAAAVVVAPRQTVLVGEDAMPLAERARMSVSVAGRIARVPGVRAAVPDISFPAYLVTSGGRLRPGADGGPSLGHSWDSAVLAPFRLLAGRAPAGPRQVVVDAGLARQAGLQVGDRARVQATGAAGAYVVTGLAEPAAGLALRRQAALFFSGSEAARLYGHPGQADAVGVLARPGADTGQVRAGVQRALAGTALAVYSGNGRGEAEFLDVAATRETLLALSGTVGGLAVMVAVFVVAGTFALAVQQRHREIGLLRAVAATPGQVRRMLAGEALLVGLAATVAGYGPGVGVAAWLRGVLVSHGILLASFRLYVGPIPVLAAGLAGGLTAQLAVLASARRAARIRPVEVIGEAAAEPRRLGRPRVLLGVLFLAGGVAVLAVSLATRSSGAAGAAPAVVMMLMVAVALLGPIVARLAATLAGAPLGRVSRVSGFLAAANARANARRLASAITPLALTVALACTVVFVQATLVRAAGLQARRGLLAGTVLQPRLAPGLPAGVVTAARAAPGVAAATGVMQTTVLGAALLPGDRHLTADSYGAQGVTPEGLASTLDLGVKSGTLAGLTGRTAALSTALAGQIGARVGDTVKIWLGDGTPAALRLVATYARGLGFGDVTLPMPLAAAHVTSPLDSLILIRWARPADPGTARPGLLRRLDARYAGVAGLPRGAFDAEQRQLLQLSVWLNYLVLAVIFLFTVIAVANTSSWPRPSGPASSRCCGWPAPRGGRC